MPIFPTQDSMNNGEITPKLHGRSTLAVYRRACEKMLNAVPQAQGGFRKRHGTRYVGAALASTGKSRLLNFTPSGSEWYTVELSDAELRVRDKDGVVVLLNGVADLYAHTFTDISAIKYVQSNDVIYLTGGGAHHTLSRFGATDWRLEELEFADGPFQTVNTDKTATIQASASTGAGITLTGTNVTFDASVVGSYIKVSEENLQDIDRWDPTHDYPVNELLRSAGNVYITTVSGDGGGKVEAVIPSHETGEYSQGPGLATFKYLHSGFGLIKITAFVNSTTLTGEAVSPRPYEDNVDAFIPHDVVTTGTSLFAFSEFYTGVYPTSVEFYQQRLVYANSERVYMSRTGNFKSFREGTNPSDAIAVEITADRFNQIISLTELNGSLLAITTGGISRLVAVDGQSISPGNIIQQRIKKQDMSSIQPIETDDSTFVIADPPTTIYEMAYSSEAGGFLSPSAAIMADHIIKQGGGVVDADISKSDVQSVKFVLKNGTIGNLIFDKYQEVIGWSRFDFSGLVKSLVVTKGVNYDDTWRVVEREIDGSTVRYIERTVRHREFGAYDVAGVIDPVDTFEDINPLYLDCAKHWRDTDTDPAPFAHLEGETVQWQSGNRMGQTIVNGGNIGLQIITLPDGSILPTPTEMWVGLPISMEVKTLRLDIGRRGDGGDLNRPQRVTKVILDVYQSGPIKVLGKSGAEDYVRSSTNTINPKPFLGVDFETGYVETPIGGSWGDEGQIEIISDDPFSCFVRSITPVTE